MHHDPLTVGTYNPADMFPQKWRDYLAGGDHPGTFSRDLGTAVDQVPRWAWGVVAVVTGGMAYLAYRADKKRKGQAK